MSARRLSQALLLLTALVWGATFPLVKAALADVSPLLFNLLRMLLATAVLLLVNRRLLRGAGEHWKAGVLAGFFLAAGYQLQTLGLARTTPVKCAFLTGLVVVFVPGLALLPRLRPAGLPAPGLNAAVGAALAFGGLVALTTPAGTVLWRVFPSMQTGDVLSLACALAFAAHLLVLGRFAQAVAPGLLATLQIACATGFMALSLPLEQAHVHWTARLLTALAVCALLATAAAFTVQSFAQQHLPPTQTVLLLTLEPVFAALTSLLILHEGLSARSLAGAALILAGILATELLPARKPANHLSRKVAV